MSRVARALAFAAANLLHPRMLWLMIWPVLVALALWGAVALVFWGELVLWVAERVRQGLEAATFFLAWDPRGAASFAAKVLLVVLLVPLVQLTALFLLGIFGMPAMVAHVAQRHFPQLARRRGGSFAGSLWNGLLALGGLAVLGVLSAPLWVIAPLWPLIPVAILGWVNQRVLRYEALAEHADAAEMRRLVSEHRGTLYLMGFGLAFVAYVPVIGWFAPLLVGLAFIHYLLGALNELREAPIEGESK